MVVASGNSPMNIVSRATGEPSQVSTVTHRDRNTLLTRPDWSLLPSDLVHLISKKITKMDHYVYFRFVCRGWRLSCPSNPRHIIPQLPWLWCDIRGKAPSIPTLTLFDFSKSRKYKIKLPYLVDKSMRGNSCGWIVLEKDMELSLINPITMEIKSNCFPSMAVPPTVSEFARTKKRKKPSPLPIYHNHIKKVILSSSPSERHCTIVASFYKEWDLGFCRIGDNCWTILKMKEYRNDEVHDLKYKNDLVYAINHRGHVTIYDLRDLSRKIIVAKPPSIGGGKMGFYFVVGEGDLDGVPLLIRPIRFRGSEKYQVLKLITDTENFGWTTVETIGNYVLLLGRYDKCEMISLGNIALNGLEGNRICYYSKKKLVGEDGSVSVNRNFTSVEIGFLKRIARQMYCDYFPGSHVCFSWFTPSLY